MNQNLVRHIIPAGSKPTHEQIARIREAEKYPIVFDDDCPELTDEQLAEFRPVNFANMEERRQAMIEAGIILESPVLTAVSK